MSGCELVAESGCESGKGSDESCGRLPRRFERPGLSVLPPPPPGLRDGLIISKNGRVKPGSEKPRVMSPSDRLKRTLMFGRRRGGVLFRTMRKWMRAPRPRSARPPRTLQHPLSRTTLTWHSPPDDDPDSPTRETPQIHKSVRTSPSRIGGTGIAPGRVCPKVELAVPKSRFLTQT